MRGSLKNIEASFVAHTSGKALQIFKFNAPPNFNKITNKFLNAIFKKPLQRGGNPPCNFLPSESKSDSFFPNF